ncbi:hypothetical protein M0804_013471 [Polistes exclamans]|nr:hypothetical protein M0804_013471 [Polistes exclamans]
MSHVKYCRKQRISILWETKKVAKNKAASTAAMKSRTRSRKRGGMNQEEERKSRPYRLVIKRLRSYAPFITKTLRADILKRILAELFPRVEVTLPPY